LHFRVGTRIPSRLPALSRCGRSFRRCRLRRLRQAHAQVRHTSEAAADAQPDCYNRQLPSREICDMWFTSARRDADGIARRALRQYAGESVIVYSPTIRRVEETVEFLEGAGLRRFRITRKWKRRCGGRIRNAGCRTRLGCWWGRLHLGWASTSGGAGGDSSVVAEVD